RIRDKGSELLQRTHTDERSKGTSKDAVSGCCHACCDSHHILFRNAHVIYAIRHFLSHCLQAQITCCVRADSDNIRIFLGQLKNSRAESISCRFFLNFKFSHHTPPTSIRLQWLLPAHPVPS